MLTIHSLLPLKTVRSVRWLRLSGSLPRACALVLTLAIFFWYLKVQNFLLSSHQIQEKNIQKSHRHYYTYCSAHAPGDALSDPRLPSPTGLYTYQFAEKLKISKNISTIPFYPLLYLFMPAVRFFLSLSWWSESENEIPVHQISLVPAQTVSAIQWSLLKSI
jgi:hypothetical protein